MSDISKLKSYPPQSVEIMRTFICNYNPAGPLVGFEVKVPGSRYGLFVLAEELKDYVKQCGNIKNAEIFKSSDKDGLMKEKFNIRSTQKDFSILSGEHVVNINGLQKLTWAGKIDYNNKVQTTFTTLC